MASAVAALTRIYTERAVPAGTDVIGVTSNTVPWELLRAAGLRPVLLSPHRANTPFADRYMEDVFAARMRAIFDYLLSGDGAGLCGVVIPRTSEQEHKLYLYLREVAREAARQGGERIPPALLYNLPHTRSHEARVYGLERTRQLKTDIENLAGRAILDEDLAAAIGEGNDARGTLRDLMRCREGVAPRLRGTEALALAGAWYFTDRRAYAAMATRAACEIEMREPLKGPRILVKGVPTDHTRLHEAVEREGAVIVAEDDWWGSRAAGLDIDARTEPLTAIFEKYFLDAPGPRVFPAAVADEWFLNKAGEADGVIFYLPPEDDVIGWDYPRLRAELDGRGIPHLLLRDESREAIGEFVAGLKDLHG